MCILYIYAVYDIAILRWQTSDDNFTLAGSDDKCKWCMTTMAGWQTVRQRYSRREALEDKRGRTTMHGYNFDYNFGNVTVHDHRRNRRVHYRYVYVIYWDSPCLGLRACQTISRSSTLQHENFQVSMRGRSAKVHWSILSRRCPLPTWWCQLVC